MIFRGIWNCVRAVCQHEEKPVRAATHLYRSSTIHVCKVDFQVGQQARSPLLLLLSSTKESREHVLLTASCFTSLVLLQSLLSVSIVYPPCLEHAQCQSSIL